MRSAWCEVTTKAAEAETTVTAEEATAPNGKPVITSRPNYWLAVRRCFSVSFSVVVVVSFAVNSRLAV
ncbi:MAG: hypothetical protein EHM48_07975 [Planctomycetaceae bacterium]|nr:MAG: hypothetical protein EHM48_07975 [Planctomycetaceae bacterium]